MKLKPFWFSKPYMERKRKDVFTSGSTLNQLTHRSAYRTVSIKDVDTNLPLVPDLRYQNLINIFGKAPPPQEKIVQPEDAETLSRSTNVPQYQTDRGATSSRFRQALENVKIPLNDRRPNPYKGNLEKEIAKRNKFNFTLDQLVDFEELVNQSKSDTSIIGENESALNSSVRQRGASQHGSSVQKEYAPRD